MIESTALEPDDVKRLLEIQEKIRKEVESTSPSKQLQDLLNEVRAINEDIQERHKLEDDAKLLLEFRKRLEEAIESSKAWKDYKKSGYDKLTESGKKLYIELDSICASKGIFIVPVGELESWLQPLGVEYSKNKGKWIVRALETLPKLNPHHTKLPWNFIERVHKYLE